MQILQAWAFWIIVIWGLGAAKAFFIPILLASLLGFLMAPIALGLRKRGAPEWLALTLTSVVLFLPVIALVVLLAREAAILVRDYPTLLASIKYHWQTLLTSPMVERFHLTTYLDVNYLTDKLGEEAGRGAVLLLNGIRTVAEASAHLLVILLFAILMLSARTQLRKSAEKLMSRNQTLDEIVILIEKFLAARLGIALFVAIVDVIIVKLFGLPYAILMGCFLGLSTLIPMVGFFVAILPPIVLSFAMGHSFLSTCLVTFFLYLVSTFETHWITPKYLGRQLNLNLLSTFTGLFAGELLWGVWGMVLSIPILGVIRILLETSEKHKNWANLLAEKEYKPSPKRLKKLAAKMTSLDV